MKKIKSNLKHYQAKFNLDKSICGNILTFNSNFGSGFRQVPLVGKAGIKKYFQKQFTHITLNEILIHYKPNTVIIEWRYHENFYHFDIIEC